MGEPFVQIRGDGPPPTFQHHHHHGAPGPAVNVPRPAGPPMQPRFPLGAHPREPPPEGVPVELRLHRPLVHVNDINDMTQEFLTVGDMRAKCTDYVVIRFEKAPGCTNGIRPAWEKAITTMVPGLSQKDIEREIQRLNRENPNVIDKKRGMGENLQRQIDWEMNKLIQGDHDQSRFEWTLVQLDHKLREVGQPGAMIRTRVPTTKRQCNTSRRSSSYHRSGKKKYYERVSLTGYFKRAPRAHVNIQHLYDAKIRALAMTSAQPRIANGHPLQPLPQPGPVPGPSGILRPPPGPAVKGQGLFPPLPNQGNQPGKGGPGLIPKVALVPNMKGQPQRVYHASESSSSSSSGGDGSDFEEESIFSSPSQSATMSSSSHSSKQDRRGRSHSRHRSRSKNRTYSRGNKRHYGIECPHKQHIIREKHYMIDSRPPPMAPAVPPPPPHSPPQAPLIRSPSSNDIERIKEDAYLAGRDDERATNRIVGELTNPRPRLAPQIIQDEPPLRGVRTIVRREIRRFTPRSPGSLDYDLGHFDRLSLDDDYTYERQLRLGDTPRRRGSEYTRRYDSFGDDDDEDFVSDLPYHGVGRRAHEYMRQREAPHIIQDDRDSLFDHPPNPFAPRVPRRVSTSGYDSPGRYHRYP